MKIKFWGVRGSIPSPLTPNNYQAKIREIIEISAKQDISSEQKISEFISKLPNSLDTTYGGNTSCVTVSTNEITVILDAGSGLRSLGDSIINGQFENVTGNKYHLFLSHLHWDHINGLPFFIPLHMENKEIYFYSAHKNCEKVLSDQQKSAFFPVSFESRPIKKEFYNLSEEENLKLNDLTINTKRLDHPGYSYSYKLTDIFGKIVVYATDGEYREGVDKKPYIDFFKDADLLIFDSQYSSIDLRSKTGFGHSSNEIGIDLAIKAKVKKLVLFHHNHEYNDHVIDENYKRAIEYCKSNYPSSQLEIIVANESLELDISKI